MLVLANHRKSLTLGGYILAPTVPLQIRRNTPTMHYTTSSIALHRK